MGIEPTQDASAASRKRFEDSVGSVRNRPPTSAPVQSRGETVLNRPHSSAVIRPLGCLIGCRRTHLPVSMASASSALQAITRSATPSQSTCGIEGAHVDGRDFASDETTTRRINTSQCSPVRGHDMSLAYAYEARSRACF